MKVLMCEPQFFDINYEINPWMDVNRGADQSLAKQQWQNLYNIILSCGADVILVEPIEGLPDMVFTANAALVYNNISYMARFKCAERQPEYNYYTDWFRNNSDYTIAEEPSNFFTAHGHYCGPSFEGAGDALFAGDTLFAASGFRSEHSLYYTICKQLGITKRVDCELINPYFYHLDTCFCPINETQAIWYPKAFAEQSRKAMNTALELFAVPENEAKQFACNAVTLNDNVIIPEGCPETRNLLEQLGKNVHECAMTEFLKSGGACKCLTLVI